MCHLKWSNCGKSKDVNTHVFTDKDCDCVVLSGTNIRLSNREMRHFITKYKLFSLLYLRGTICD